MRSSISIVPQSPDLFEGTIRENIDPVGEHADLDIWTALDQVNNIYSWLDILLTDTITGTFEAIRRESAGRS